jgi:integrase
MKIPKLCRHRGRSLAYVRVDGQQIYLGAWPEGSKNPCREALIKYRDLIGKIATDRPAIVNKAPGGITVMELVVEFLENHRDSIDYVNFRSALSPVVAHYGDQLAADFGPNKLRKIQEWLVAHPYEVGKRGTAEAELRERTRSGINIIINRIRRCWKWGISRELVNYEVLAKLQTLEPLHQGRGIPEAPPRVAVAREDVEATLPFLGPQHQAMVRLQQLTAMRPGEVCIMTTGEIDRSSKKAWYYKPAKHKNAHRGKGRVIVLSPLAITVVTPWLRADPDRPLFSPADRMAALGKVRKGTTLRPPGDQYNAASYGRAIAKACKKAGVKTWSPNQLRKLAANEVSRLGGEDLARAFLGHPDAATTRRFYLESEMAKATQAANLLG